MVGWLAKKAQNSRVYMCTREVKWEFEAADPVRRASIQIIACMVLNDLATTGFPLEVIDRPLDFSRDHLWPAYEQLETVRNLSTQELTSTKRSLKNLGMDLPPFAIDQAKKAGRAVELWMCTIGIGILPDRRDDMRLVWNQIVQARPYLPAALNQLQETEMKTVQMTGQPVDTFAEITLEDLDEVTSYIPSVAAPARS